MGYFDGTVMIVSLDDSDPYSYSFVEMWRLQLGHPIVGLHWGPADSPQRRQRDATLADEEQRSGRFHVLSNQLFIATRKSIHVYSKSNEDASVDTTTKMKMDLIEQILETLSS
jgi:hypothetical protein